MPDIHQKPPRDNVLIMAMMREAESRCVDHGDNVMCYV